MRPLLPHLIAASAAIAITLPVLPVRAGVYQALCSGGGGCTVTLANGQLSMPGLTIEDDQILSWSQGGSGTKTDVGMGVATTLLFGLPGLIGFGAKTHDYQFNINYVDDDGNVQATSVVFKNNTPANQFMMELMGMTRLSMGELNNDLQARIDGLKQEAAERQRIASLDCARVLKAYGCSWSTYLEANPNVQIWAERYPQMVPAEKARLGAID
ncbi:MAG: hypothetical protein R6U00_10700 [Prochlorococcaceae cyanobacterium]